MTLEQSSSVLTLERVKTQTITEIFIKNIHEQFQGLLSSHDSAEYFLYRSIEIILFL
jgi:hypothetical protein